MSMQTKTIGRMPTDHGPYDPQLAYGKKYQCELFGCVWESLHDNNNTAPAVWDGGDIITPNLVDWKKASGSYEAWLMNKDKPATTGTTGDYPYNGMGRVKLAKNIVNGVNTLTQDMFYKGAVGSRVPNTNTIFVIQYDYVLGENITVPANCVLDFEGGSIANATGNTYKISGTSVFIKNIDEYECLKNVDYVGTFECENYYYVSLTITQSISIPLNRTYPKDSFVELTIIGLNNHIENNALLLFDNGNTRVLRYRLGTYCKDCTIQGQAFGEFNYIRLIYIDSSYSFKFKVYKKTANINKDVRSCAKTISPQKYTYCQVPNICKSSARGVIYGVYCASERIFCEQDGNNSKKLVLFYKTLGFDEVTSIEITPENVTEKTDSNYNAYRDTQNSNIVVAQGKVIVIADATRKSDNAKFIGYYEIPENTMQPTSDKISMCTIDNNDFTQDNIISVLNNYNINISKSDINYWMPQCQIYDSFRVYYQGLTIVKTDGSSIILIIKTTNGKDWTSVYAYNSDGDESACCVVGNLIYIIQRLKAEAILVDMDNKQIVGSYNLNIPVENERPFCFMYQNHPYYAIGRLIAPSSDNVAFFRYGYDIINGITGSYEQTIFDSDGLAYLAIDVVGKSIIGCYQSNKRFKGGKNNYPIINDEGVTVDTYVKPEDSITNDIQFIELDSVIM